MNLRKMWHFSKDEYRPCARNKWIIRSHTRTILWNLIKNAEMPTDQNRNLQITDLFLVSVSRKCTHRKPFLCSSGTRFTHESFLTRKNKNKKNKHPKQNRTNQLSPNANHALFLFDSNGTFLAAHCDARWCYIIYYNLMANN